MQDLLSNPHRMQKIQSDVALTKDINLQEAKIKRLKKQEKKSVRAVCVQA